MLATQPSHPRYVIDWTPVRHVASFLDTSVEIRIRPPAKMSRATLARTLRDAVGRLRTVENAFTRRRRDPRHAAITAAVMAGCRRVRDATAGYFDPWAMPGGFDPSGLLVGWAVERAAAALTDAGLADFAIAGRDELLVRGSPTDGDPWRVGIRHPGAGLTLAVSDTALSTSAGRVVDPHTQRRARHFGAVTVLGPDLGIADAYATGLRAAGPAGLSWFPTPDGYRTVLFTEPRPEDSAGRLAAAA